jgi:AAT family amino acid transporter
VSYLIGAVIAGIVAYCLAEMAVVQPLSGSFGNYAETYLSRWAGFCVRVTYGLVQIIAIGAEVTAVGIYFAFWFPHVSAWIWIAGVSLGLVVVNSLQVANFGEFEYWFAAIKVLAIAAFIVIGFALIVGRGHGPAFGIRNLFAFGGFFPHGFHGVWLALTLVVTSYMGVEVVAVTAGEVTDPGTSVPRAMRAILLRLLLFYGLAISIMLCLTPWNSLSAGGINGSPFVKAFASIGIPFSATIMNAVVITAALSSANTNLYLSTRMLYSPSRGRYAPEWLGGIGANGIPRYALAVSASGMVVAILLAVFAPILSFGSQFRQRRWRACRSSSAFIPGARSPDLLRCWQFQSRASGSMVCAIPFRFCDFSRS